MHTCAKGINMSISKFKSNDGDIVELVDSNFNTFIKDKEDVSEESFQRHADVQDEYFQDVTSAAKGLNRDVSVAPFKAGGRTEGSLDIANGKTLLTIGQSVSDQVSALIKNDLTATEK